MMISATGRQRTVKGFALVEALIAFLILALGVMACLQGLAQSLRASKKIDGADRLIARLAPLMFQIEAGQRHDLPPLTLDRLDPDFRPLLDAGRT